ncbi:MAG: cytochrome bc1 complex Rieske iron-sulfur subunit [Mycobacteriales bacterium]
MSLATPPPGYPAVAGPDGPGPPETPEVDARADRRAERRVAAWFWLSTLGALGFVALIWQGNLYAGYYNPLLAVTLALSLLGMGIGAISWAKTLMPHETAVQERESPFPTPEDQEQTGDILRAGIEGSGIARRKLLRRSVLTAGGALLLPVLASLRQLGPRPKGELTRTDWSAGSRMVDPNGNLVRFGDLEIGGFQTVFPQGYVDAAADPVLLIRLGPGVNHPLPGRADWSYQGHVAYSKLCTHLGCPVGLYEQQTHHLLCPCHQSLFDAAHGCKPLFGPASRPLPQLPITVDSQGYFIAQAGFDQPVGPGFWERK